MENLLLLLIIICNLVLVICICWHVWKYNTSRNSFISLVYVDCAAKDSQKSALNNCASKNPVERWQGRKLSFRCGRENPTRIFPGKTHTIRQGLKTLPTSCPRWDLNRDSRGGRQGKIPLRQPDWPISQRSTVFFCRIGKSAFTIPKQKHWIENTRSTSCTNNFLNISHNY